MKIKKENSEGLMINRGGENRYCHEGDIEREIRYVTRQRKGEKRESELISWGAFGLPEWGDAEAIVEAFRIPQRAYKRRGNFGRYLDHDVYDLSPFEQEEIEHYNIDLDRIGRIVAKNIYQEGHQVLYAVHQKTESEMPHIHLIINTVNFKTGKKRHENMPATKKQGEVFHDLVAAEIKKEHSRKRILERAFS